MEYSQADITKRLAHTVWCVFEKAEITNDPEGNYRVADSIVQRIINRTYTPDEWSNFIPEDDMRVLLELREKADRSE